MADWYNTQRVKQQGSVVLRSWVAQRKESAAGAAIARVNIGRPVFSGRNYATFSKEAYQLNIIAYRCIHLISTSAARVPWLLYRDDKEIDEHAMLTLLKRPNPMQSGEEYFAMVYAFDLLAGNSYLERVPVGGNKRIKELWSLRPDRMKVVPGRFGLPQRFEHTVHGKMTPFDVDPITGQGNILHVKRFNPLDDWYGQSPLEAMCMSIDSHNEATRWNFAVLRNGARPSGALEYPTGNLDDVEYERLKAEIEGNYGSGWDDPTSQKVGRQGRPMLLQGGLKWVQMMLTAIDIDWLKGKEASAREVAIGYNVPEQLVGVPGQQTYNNYREARMALYEDAVLPLLDRFAEAITNWMQDMPEFVGLRLSYDEDQIPALAPRRESMWDKVNAAKFLSIDEKREALGYGVYEPDEKTPGSFIYVTASELPLTDAFNDLALSGMEEQPVPTVPAEEVEEPAAPKPGKPMPTSVSAAPVANLALNGGQIQAAVQIVQAVVDGTLPAESAIQLLLVAFPSIDESTARAMVAAAEAFEPEKPEPPVLMPGVPAQPPAAPGQPPKPAQPPKKPETDVEKGVMWALLELKQCREKELVRKAHDLAYGKEK